ncbi:MAG: long-chain fatty acid--CoA ligase [Fibrobacter sp.]|nr:long-chain fatty acid--CoA ligase [Fibrobacter sp.]
MQTMDMNLARIFLNTCENKGFLGWYFRENNAWTSYPKEQLKKDLFLMSLALKSRGVSLNQNVGIIAPTSPHWIIADLAIQLVGGISVPLFPNISTKNFSFQCEEANVKFLIVKNIEELDLALQEKCHSFQWIISLEPIQNPKENMIEWNDLLEEATLLAENINPDEWLNHAAQNIQADQIFSIIYTSGSTGTPKGVPLTHKNIVSQLISIQEIFNLDPKVDTALSILPIAHVFERMVLYYYVLAGIQVYFADDPQNTGVLLYDTKASVITVVPRILERLYEKMTAAAENKSGLQKLFLKKAIRQAKIIDPFQAHFSKKIYEKLVYKKMREAIGDNFKYIISGSSALNKSINRFLLNIGLPVYEGYGLTETSPVVSVNYKNHLKLGSVGKKLKHLEVKLSENKEILVKGDSVFSGYYNSSELNKNIFTEDGYFKTGDEAYIDEEGYIYIVGRIKEMLKTSTGKYVSPLPIELEISRHPFVEAALVIANNRKYPSALLFMNFENTRRYLKKTLEEFDPQEALLSKKVNTALERHIANVNKKLNHWEQIQKWQLITDPLTIESGLLTPTLKLRRKATEAAYAEIIENLY